MGNSSGKYLWFVDSDDWLAPGALSTVGTILLNHNPEGVHLCRADIINGEPQQLFNLSSCTDRHYSGMELLRSNNFHGVVQYTVYRRDFHTSHNLRFMEGIYHEDTEFSPRAYYYLKDVACIDRVLYHKRVNDNSITRTVNPKKNYDLVKVSQSLRDFASGISDKADRSYFMRLSSNAFKMAMTTETKLMDKDTRRKFNNHLRDNSHLLRSFFESDRAVSKVEGTLLTLVSGNMISVNNYIFHNPLLRKLSGN